MANKPWPKDNAPLHFGDLVGPVVKAIRQAYKMRLRRSIYKRGLKWTGYDIGARDKACCCSPDAHLTGENLLYSNNNQGRSPLEEIVALAVKTGIEQGRRLQWESGETERQLVRMASNTLREVTDGKD